MTALDRLAHGDGYHDFVMPELVKWFRYLSARLRHVRFMSGDWRRAVTSGVMLSLSVRSGKGPCGVFLDPPYADTAERMAGVYAEDSGDVSHAVAQWAVANGDNPLLRIVMAGYEGEHDADLFKAAGWSAHEWFTTGWFAGGMANQSNDGEGGGSQQHRERLWASPHCHSPNVEPAQTSLWEVEP